MQTEDVWWLKSVSRQKANLKTLLTQILGKQEKKVFIFYFNFKLLHMMHKL